MRNQCCGRRKENRAAFAKGGSGAEPRPAAFAGSSSPSPIALIAGMESSPVWQEKKASKSLN